MRNLPKRIATAHVEAVGDELCVYDWDRHVVHTLNRTAAAVWQMCDGRTSSADMAATLHSDLPVAHGQALVSLALRELDGARLLAQPIELPDPASRPPVTRRDLLVRAAGTALLLPVITSIVAPTPLEAQSGASQTFGFTGAPQTFVVPVGATRITVSAAGAAGGIYSFVTFGARGGAVLATLPVTAGETLLVVVGGAGPDRVAGSPTAVGGFNGGGGSAGDGGAGGGASEVRRGAVQLVVAGGGGGSSTSGLTGGAGGGLAGGNGITVSVAQPGTGGTQTAGGAGGSAGPSSTAGTAGAAGIGGIGGRYTGPELTGGGGGGGGYFGGGGGAGGNGTLPDFRNFGAGGGGGSSYTDPAATAVVHQQGVRSGNGLVTIFWS